MQPISPVQLAEFMEGPWVRLHEHINQNGITTGPRKLAMLVRAMKLRNVPPLYSQENVQDPIVRVKLFDPCSRWTWFIYEFSEVAPDGCTNLAHGLVRGHCSEKGYISLEELANTPGRLRIGIEIDTWFLPTLLSDIESGIEN